MKSLNFKRKEDSYLRYFDEKNKKAKKPFNWDRFIYLILLTLALFFLIRFIIKNYFYIEGNGQVLFESVDIRHTDDIRILEFYKEEGEDVRIGDTLFTYFLDEDVFGASGIGGQSVSIGGGGEGGSWVEREIYNLKKNIELNKVRINDSKKLLGIYEADLKRVRNEVILDAVSHTNLENLEYQINRLQAEISLDEEENRVFARQISYLEGLVRQTTQRDIQINQRSSGGGSGGSGDSEGPRNRKGDRIMLTGAEGNEAFQIFTCPIDGTITRINKQPYEVALKTETILSVHQAEEVRIKGFFDQHDLAYLNEGDYVDIEFADGTESIGIINRFYSATYILPEEFQKKFEPTTRTLAADILPIGENDLNMWKKYYKLSVRISKRTF